MSFFFSTGYVSSPSAVAIGFLAVVAANYATKLKHIFKFDDALDVFSTHAVGGFVGSIRKLNSNRVEIFRHSAFLVLVTGVFAEANVTAYDGLTMINGGWLNKNWIQVAYQLASSAAILSYTFVMTMVILLLLDYIPGCSLRASEEAEIIGIDEDQVSTSIILLGLSHSYFFLTFSFTLLFLSPPSVRRDRLRLCIFSSRC